MSKSITMPIVAPISLGTSRSDRPSRTGIPIGSSSEFAAPKVALGYILALRLHEVRHEEVEVGRLLGQPTHEVGVPLISVGNVDPQSVALFEDLAVQVSAHAGEHLELEPVTVTLEPV